MRGSAAAVGLQQRCRRRGDAEEMQRGGDADAEARGDAEGRRRNAAAAVGWVQSGGEESEK